MKAGTPERHGNNATATWRDRGSAFTIYVGCSLLGHLLWETAQLPLYEIWRTAGSSTILFAVAHCTAGDGLITATTLLASLLLLRAVAWPSVQFGAVAAATVALGLIYTGFSEWLNVYVRRSWAYSPSMPTLTVAGFDIGLSPLLQWIVVPLVVFAILARWRRSSGFPCLPGGRRAG